MPERGLEPGKREMRLRPSEHRTRQFDVRVSLRRASLDRGPTWIGEPEKFRRLIERLAERVVERSAEPRIAPDALDAEKLRVPARDGEQQIGKIESMCQARSHPMGFEMIDGDEGEVARKRYGLARHHPNDQSSDQPGPRR